MNPGEWCAVVHVDIGMRTGLEVVEEALAALVDGSADDDGTLDVAALRLDGKPNHFEVIGRFVDESSYQRHVVSSANLAFRKMIAPVLGSPYEDRLHAARGDQNWPTASVGDVVVITQVEAQPTTLDAAERAFDALVSAQSGAEGLLGQVALQRRFLPTNFEVVSVWSSTDAFDRFLGTEQASVRRSELEASLVAPIDDRRYAMIAGSWSRA